MTDLPHWQEELESREMLFRDLGDPLASFANQLEANTANLVCQYIQ
jgi:hypothetical protein